MHIESITTAQSSPTNPTGTTSTTAVMMGVAGSIRMQGSKRILIMISGDISNDTTTDGVTARLSYGTGTAPVNGAALTGTQVGTAVSFTALTGVLTVPFAIQAIVSGLTLGTLYWIDLAVAAVTGGTSSVSNLSVSVIEL